MTAKPASPASPSPATAADLRAVEGRYLFRRPLGRGAEGRVWLALDLQDDQARRAVKVVAAAQAERLRWEWQVLSRVQHPALCRVFDLLRVSQAYPALDLPVGAVLMVSEYVPGEPLDRTLDLSTALVAGFSVARALSAFHRAGLVHGDVKPSNVLSHAKHATLIDPSLAGPPSTTQTIAGTPAYLAPEVWRGERTYAADVFALGLTLLHCLSSSDEQSASKPVVDSSPSVTDVTDVTAHLRDALTAHTRARALSTEVPEPLRTLIASMLSPEPHTRPSAIETAARLAAIAHELNLQLPWHDAESELIGAGVDELSTGPERAAALTNLPLVGQVAALNALRARLSSVATAAVTRVVGAVGSGRSRVVRDAVAALQAERVGQGGAVPSYLVLRALPERVPPHDCVIHVQDAIVNGVEAVTEADARALVESAEVDGATVSVVLECDVERPRDPTRERPGADDVVVQPLSRAEVTTLLQHALPDEVIDAARVERAMADSGGLAGRLIRGLVTRDALFDDHRAVTDVAVSIPLAAQPVAALLACAGGALDATTVQRVLGEDADLSLATHHLQQRGLATIQPDGRLRLRPDVIETARATLTLAQQKALAQRALGKNQPVEPAVRGYLLHSAGDTAAAIDAWTSAVIGLRDAGQATAAVQLGLDALSRTDNPRTDNRDVSRRAGLQLGVARTSLLLGRYAEVVALLSPVTSIEACVCVAEAERRAGRLDAARDVLLAAGAADATSSDVAACRARLEFDAGQYGLAREHAVIAVTQSGWSRVRGVEVQALCALRDADPVAARQHAERAIEHAREQGLSAETSRALSVLATIQLSQGQLAAAAAHYAEALALAERVGDVHATALCLLNLGLSRVDLGDVGAGVSTLRDASRRLLRLGRSSDAARALYNLGNAASLIGDDDIALSALRLAEKAATASELSSARAYTTLCEAEIRTRRGERDRATACVTALAAIDGLSEDETSVVAARGAAVWLLLGERDAAERLFARAPSDEAKLSCLSSLTNAELALTRARLFTLNGDLTQALTAVERALWLSERAGTFELRLRTAFAMAQTLEACGRGHEATRFLERARQWLDQLAAGLSPSERARLRDVSAYRPAFKVAPARTSVADSSGSERWKKLASFSKQLVGEHRASRLLDRVLDAAIELANAERGFVVEQVDGQLRVRASRGLTAATLNDASAPSRTFVARVISEGRPLASVDALQDARLDAAASVHALSLRSVIAVPLCTEDRVAGAIYLDDRLRPFAFGEEEVALLSNLADVAALALDGVHRLHAAQAATKRLKRLRRRLRRTVETQALELSSLRNVSDGQLDHPSIVGRGPAMRALLAMVDRVARSELPVLISGESGTGKELVARTIHDHGSRKAAAFISENCSAIPETLLESALFGHVRGAFTGADRPRVGLFDAADGGTLFLDEIGEMSPAMQVRLLRVLQDGEIRPVGSERVRKVDVRVIAATHRDLQQMVRDGTFREDLYYRLAVVSLKMPALRERPEDIAELVAHFVRKHGTPNQTSRIDRKTLSVLSKHPWPGNVRQLENEIRRALVLADGPVRPEHLSPSFSGEAQVADDDLGLRGQTDALERRLIQAALVQTHNNQTRAAKLLGISRYGLQKMLKRLGLAGG